MGFAVIFRIIHIHMDINQISLQILLVIELGLAHNNSGLCSFHHKEAILEEDL